MKLIINDDNTVALIYNGNKIRGSFKDIVSKMHLHFGVSFDEIELGLEHLFKNDHNAIEFGDVNKTFMYTERIVEI